MPDQVRRNEKASRIFSGRLFHARTERFERPTAGSVGRCSIQLSYVRMGRNQLSNSGEGGIRTLGTGWYTRLASVRLWPLGHLPIDAEDQGFEPRVPFDTTVFKTAAFDRSASPPVHCM